MSLKRLDQEDITVSIESVATSAWSNNTPELTSFSRNSDQTSSTSGQFFHEIYNKDPNDPEAEVQFSIAYGNIDGDGSDPFTGVVPENTPTSVTYKQYRNLIFGTEEDLEGEEKKFKFDDVKSDEILIINIERSRYKERLLPGSFELTLKKGNDEIVLEDNSSEQVAQVFTDAGREFKLILKDSDGDVDDEAINSYGKLYPDIGVIILNAEALKANDDEGGLDIDLDSTGDGPLDAFRSALNDGGSFKLQSEETISSNILFVRARNAEFNYTTNPSIIDITGEIRNATLINSPQTYITTVGLYNDKNQLLAVAKLSRPLLKDFNKEALIRIKLDF